MKFLINEIGEFKYHQDLDGENFYYEEVKIKPEILETINKHIKDKLKDYYEVYFNDWKEHQDNFNVNKIPPENIQIVYGSNKGILIEFFKKPFTDNDFDESQDLLIQVPLSLYFENKTPFIFNSELNEVKFHPKSQDEIITKYKDGYFSINEDIKEIIMGNFVFYDPDPALNCSYYQCVNNSLQETKKILDYSVKVETNKIGYHLENLKEFSMSLMQKEQENKLLQTLTEELEKSNLSNKSKNEIKKRLKQNI